MTINYIKFIENNFNKWALVQRKTSWRFRKYYVMKLHFFITFAGVVSLGRNTFLYLQKHLGFLPAILNISITRRDNYQPFLASLPHF